MESEEELCRKRDNQKCMSILVRWKKYTKFVESKSGIIDWGKEENYKYIVNWIDRTFVLENLLKIKVKVLLKDMSIIMNYLCSQFDVLINDAYQFEYLFCNNKTRNFIKQFILKKKTISSFAYTNIRGLEGVSISN